MPHVKPPRKQTSSGKGESLNSPIEAKQRASRPAAIKRRRDEGLPAPRRGLVRLGAVNTDILTGYEDITLWDDEELARGQKRDKNGRFQGRQPVVVPTVVHNEMVRRQMKQAETLLQTALVPACQALADIISNDATEDKDKLRAVDMILNRVLGKSPERVEITGEMKPWEHAIVAAVVPSSPLSEAFEVSEVDEDDEDKLDI